MHRNKDVILGEDGYTNCCDNAPLKHFLPHRLRSQNPEIRGTLTPTRAIEHFQDDRNRAIRLFSGFY